MGKDRFSGEFSPPRRSSELAADLIGVTGTVLAAALAYNSGLSEFTAYNLKSVHLEPWNSLSDNIHYVANLGLKISMSCLYGVAGGITLKSGYRKAAQTMTTENQVRAVNLLYRFHPARVLSPLS